MNEFFRRNLPHFHAKNATYFVTFRLAGSLPIEVLAEMRQDFEQQENLLKEQHQGQVLQDELYKLQKRFFARHDNLLDCAEHGPRWLADPRFAEIVVREILALHPECYHLHTYCLMSNHVHLLVNQHGIAEPKPLKARQHYTALSHTMRLLKGRTGYACSRLLDAKGAFWQHESYDHVVRDEKEFERIHAYIINNPVKAGLVKEWQDWPYTYTKSL